MAYQFNRPETDDGIILAFRRNNCGKTSVNVKPDGLKADANYEVNFEDYGIVITKTGKEIMEKGFEVKIPMQPGSLLISYKVRN
jgi:alpha-galactosidase